MIARVLGLPGKQVTGGNQTGIIATVEDRSEYQEIRTSEDEKTANQVGSSRSMARGTGLAGWREASLANFLLLFQLLAHLEYPCPQPYEEE
jgi:hypothetical protein